VGTRAILDDLENAKSVTYARNRIQISVTQPTAKEVVGVNQKASFPVVRVDSSLINIVLLI
jgi:hypothetical protein